MLNTALLSPADHVLVAVSGGPDSLALLHLLHAHKGALGLAFLSAAHCNHGLRGDESDGDAAFVTDFCAARQIPCIVGNVTVRARRDGMQAAARRARLAFLEATAAEVGATLIATAHTADDQAETVLFHVLRGSGLDGLAGIPARRGLYARPLLGVTRAEIEAYCASHAIFPRRDSSNLDASHYTRNRIRLELLPLLARDYNSDVKGALVRLGEIAARDADFLREQAEAALSEAVLADDIFPDDKTRLILDARKLRLLHPGLLRHVVRAAIFRIRGTLEGVDFSHVEKISDAVLLPPAAPFGLTTPAPAVAVRVTTRQVTFKNQV